MRVREACCCCWVPAPLCSEASGRGPATMDRGQGLCHGTVLALRPFFGSRMNHHCYGCQTQHPLGCQPHSPMPKLAEISWGSCKADGIALHLLAEEHPNRSHCLAGARLVPTPSPWLRVSLLGKPRCSAQGTSHHGASITRTLKVIKHPWQMSPSLGGGKPVCERRSC